MRNLKEVLRRIFGKVTKALLRSEVQEPKTKVSHHLTEQTSVSLGCRNLAKCRGEEVPKEREANAAGMFVWRTRQLGNI